MNEEAIKRIIAVGRAEALFRSIDVDLADQRRLAAAGLEMLETSRAMAPGELRPGMFVPEPSGSGKSAAARRIVLEAAKMAGVPPERSPARLITLDTVGSVKSIWSSILEGLGDPNFEAGYETLQRKRTSKAIARNGVHLLMIDEFNHVADASQARRGSNAIKNLLTAGWTSVIVLGTSEELNGMPDNAGFERRMIRSPGLPARTWPRDAASWTAYLGELDARIVEMKLLDERAGLDREVVAKAMCSLCDGVIGDAAWVVREALKDAVRLDRKSISLRDLADNGDALLRKKRTRRINPLGALL